MQASGSNILKGKVVKVVQGAVSCEVTLEIAPGMKIVGIITKASATLLDLAEGKTALAVIRASDVAFGVDLGEDLGVDGD
jgi:molybdopterin-binding protein